MAELNELLEDALDDLLETNNEQEQQQEQEQKQQSSETNKNNPPNTSNVEEEIREHFERLAPQLQEEMQGDGAVPQIFGMMQNLISKELLYPALKDLLPKFEEWLKKDLNEEDRARYGEQKDLIREMVDTFEDDSLTSQQMFERNLELMEKMQSLGSPPQDLTVPDAQNCAIM